MFRRVSLSIAACFVGALAIACGTDAELTGSRAIAVQPRVVVDGMVELGAVAAGVADASLIIDEVLFHAPTVEVREGETVVDDLLAAEDPLLFRYDASSSDGFGDVVGGERRWIVSEQNTDGDLFIGFAPLSVTDQLVSTGVDLTGLTGHTATVHGYMLMSAPDAAGLSNNACEGDPDGNPANSEGDPDGNPSEGDPDGNPAEGDPDGNPAKGEGDPDGNPSEEEVEGRREGESLRQELDENVRATDGRVLRERVPFLLVLNRSFSLRVPVAGLFEDVLAEDEVRPLELHVRLDELLSEEVLAFLAKKATDQERGEIVVEIPEADVGLDIDNKGVERRVRAEVSSGGIRVIDGR